MITFIQYSSAVSTGWTCRARIGTIGGMPTNFHVEKLSDEFGQFTLVLKCLACDHERTAEPHTLGRLCGWDTRLDDLAKRLRCSKCGQKNCIVRAIPRQKPRRYTSLPN